MQEARKALQAALELDGNPARVSVYDLRMAFRGDSDLLEEVVGLLGAAAASALGGGGGLPAAGGSEGGGTSTAPADGAEAGAAAPQPAAASSTAATGGSAATAAAAASTAATAAASAAFRCQLPSKDPNYTGRDAEAEQLAGVLAAPGAQALLLVAPGGYGKSCLAVDVGWRLVAARRVPAGALWVDLREASSASEVTSRFLAAAGVDKEEQLMPRLQQAVAAAAAAGGEDGGGGGGDEGGGGAGAALLLVVDNAEDPLNCDGGRAKLNELLGKLLLLTTPGGGGGGGGSGAGAAKVLITTRPTQASAPLALPPSCSAAGVTLHTHVVGEMDPAAAAGLLSATCSDLTPEEVQRLCAACCYVPLVLRTAGEALAAGRTTVEELLQHAAAHGGGSGGAGGAGGAAGGGGEGGGGGDGGGAAAGNTRGQLALVLGCISRRQQQAIAQLSIFPSGFDDEAAGVVLYGGGGSGGGSSGGGAAAAAQQARPVLRLLYRAGLLSYNSARHQYVMHMAVRRAAGELAAAACPAWLRDAEARYGTHVAGCVSQYEQMYGRAAEWRVAMAMTRDAQTDITNMLKLGPVTSGALGRVVSSSTLDLLNALNMLRPLNALLGTAIEVLAAEQSSSSSSSSSSSNSSSSSSTGKAESATAPGSGGGAGEAAQQAAAKAAADAADAASALVGLLLLHAWSHYLLHQFAKGEKVARRALQAAERGLGKEHPTTLTVLFVLASCIKDQVGRAGQGGRRPAAGGVWHRYWRCGNVGAGGQGLGLGP